MNQVECQQILEGLSYENQAKLLLSYGFYLTIRARNLGGKSNSSLLMEINEINHRLFPQIESLLYESESRFTWDIISYLILGESSFYISEEDKSVLQTTCQSACQSAFDDVSSRLVK